MKQQTLAPQSLLSTLWIFVLLNMIFRDLHQFASDGFIQELMSLNISEELVLVFGIVLEVPILMVVLSRVLSNRLNKWINLVAVFITALGILSNANSADMDDIFFMVMEILALVYIVRTALKLTVEPKDPSHG